MNISRIEPLNRGLFHPLRSLRGRGEPDATLAHRMGEGLGVRVLGEVRVRFMRMACVSLT
jgi:hypothetical protein